MLIGRSISMQRKNIVKDGLVLWLDGKDFTNSPPTSQLRDRSGNDNNATPSGMVYTSLSGSDGNGGIVFDGIDDILTVPYSSPMKLGGNDFTIGTTIIFDNNSLYQVIMTRRKTPVISNEYSFYFANATGTIEFKYTTDGATNIPLSFTFVPVVGVQYDICLKREGDNLYLFINGVKHNTVNTIAGTVFNSNEPLLLGALRNDTVYNSFLIGKIKRILQYNRALTDTEILQNYNTTK